MKMKKLLLILIALSFLLMIKPIHAQTLEDFAEEPVKELSWWDIIINWIEGIFTADTTDTFIRVEKDVCTKDESLIVCFSPENLGINEHFITIDGKDYGKATATIFIQALKDTSIQPSSIETDYIGNIASANYETSKYKTDIIESTAKIEMPIYEDNITLDINGKEVFNKPIFKEFQEVNVTTTSINKTDIKDLGNIDLLVGENYTFNVDFIIPPNLNDVFNYSVIINGVNYFLPYPIIINTPSNQTNFIAGQFNISLGIRADDDNVSKALKVLIYGSNSSRDTDLNNSNLLFISNYSVFNGSTITYNWTSPVINTRDKSLVLLYHFDNLTERNEDNGTFFNDSSGNGNSGTLEGVGNRPNWNFTGKFGGAERFDNPQASGSAARINISASNTLNLSLFTVSFWWNADVKCIVAFGGPMQFVNPTMHGFEIVDEAGLTTAYYPHLIIKNGTTEFRNYKAGASIACPFNKFIHMVWIWNGTVARYFQDGVEKTVATGGANYDTGTNFIGFSYAGINGTLDEIAIWNRTLDENEVLDLYRLKNGTYYWIANVSNGTGSSQLSPMQSFCIGNNNCVITVGGNTAPTLSSATLNYTNATLTRTGEQINTSVTIVDIDVGDKANWTAILFVNRVANQTLQGVGTALNNTLSIVFNATNITKNQVIGVQFNATDGTAVSNYLNATEITVNDTAPILSAGTLNETNATLFITAEQINSSITISDVDSENNYITAILFVNRIANQTQQVGTINIGSAGRIVSIVFNATNITIGQVIGIQFNATSTGDSSDAVYLNGTDVTVNNSAPILSNPAINYTNATLTVTSEQINASVTISDSDSTSFWTTATLFVNRIIRAIIDFFTGHTGTASIVFNDTNITKGDLIEVQFNTSDGTSSSNYINTSGITVNDTLFTTSNIQINYTNATLRVTGNNINASIIVTDIDTIDRFNGTFTLFKNRISYLTLQYNTNAKNGSTLSLIFNNTNIIQNDILTFQANLTDGIYYTPYENATAITVGDTVPSFTGEVSINVTNATFNPNEITNSSLFYSDPELDKANITRCAFINRTLRQNTCTTLDNQNSGSNVSFTLSTSINYFEYLTIQFNGTSNGLLIGYVNSSTITVNFTNIVSTLSLASLNETNATFFRLNWLSASVFITDTESNDVANISAIVFVNNNRKQTITNNNVIGTTSFSFPNQWGRFDNVTVMFNGTNNGNLISPINTSQITVNTSKPISNIGNSTVSTNININIHDLNLSQYFSDKDNLIQDLNHTGIVWNDTSKVSTITLTNGTHLFTSLLIFGEYGIIEVNVTTLDNESLSTFESFRMTINNPTITTNTKDISTSLTLTNIGIALFFLFAFVILHFVAPELIFLKIMMLLLGFVFLIMNGAMQFHLLELQEITNATLKQNLNTVLTTNIRVLTGISILILLYMWVMALFGTWEKLREYILKLFKKQ